MRQVTKDEKKKIAEKLLKFKKKGLESYGSYLDEQFIYASKKNSRKQYKKYIKNQLAMNNKKIQKINAKLLDI